MDDITRNLAYAVEFEQPIEGYWEGFSTRGLTEAAAAECALVKLQFGARNIAVVRDEANDGSATNGQWV